MNEQGRRTFFKTLLTIPASLLFNGICAGESESKTYFSEIQIPPHLLKSEIEKCLEDINFYVCFGEPDSAVIYAFRGFVEIFDKNPIDLKQWNEYFAFCNQTFDDVPCIISDNIQDLCLPKTKAILRFDLCNHDSIAEFITTIIDIKKQMKRNLPEQFKHRSLERPLWAS